MSKRMIREWPVAWKTRHRGETLSDTWSEIAFESSLIRQMCARMLFDVKIGIRSFSIIDGRNWRVNQTFRFWSLFREWMMRGNSNLRHSARRRSSLGSVELPTLEEGLNIITSDASLWGWSVKSPWELRQNPSRRMLVSSRVATSESQ